MRTGNKWMGDDNNNKSPWLQSVHRRATGLSTSHLSSRSSLIWISEFETPSASSAYSIECLKVSLQLKVSCNGVEIIIGIIIIQCFPEFNTLLVPFFFLYRHITKVNEYGRGGGIRVAGAYSVIRSSSNKQRLRDVCRLTVCGVFLNRRSEWVSRSRRRRWRWRSAEQKSKEQCAFMWAPSECMCMYSSWKHRRIIITVNPGINYGTENGNGMDNRYRQEVNSIRTIDKRTSWILLSLHNHPVCMSLHRNTHYTYRQHISLRNQLCVVSPPQ